MTMTKPQANLILLTMIGAILMTRPDATAQDKPTDAAKTGKRVAPSAAEAHGDKPHLKNEDGTWKWTNRLAKESSPYLLQHAHNPVDWYAWGPEAFEAARQSGKPIFLSIGYSTCYWCHVMERQCFEKEIIAKQMNAQFICIKVDREERPDVDDIYMTATQLMTGSGGWPMSVFLTPPGANGEKDPGLKPFWAGTYLPPEPRHGIQSFPQVMNAIHETYRDQKKHVLEVADRAAGAVSDRLGQSVSKADIDEQAIALSVSQLMRGYDPRHGGFGGAPKFPTPNNLQFLLGMHQIKTNDQVFAAVSHTLDRMARGGMYDQVGGGFHRYSVDAQWLVPHFEKMLYDNAQLVETYLTAHAIKPRQDDPRFYERVVRETCDYVLREMTDKTGAFWSAQDAEVDHKEGGSYVWTADQVNAVIKDESLRDLAMAMYGLDKGPNFQDPHHPEADKVNVIFLPQSLADLAKAKGMTLDEAVDARQKINALLLASRDQRKQPGTDDKVLVSWNGMMIAAMARAGDELKAPRYTQAAKAAADAVLKHMRKEDGGLFRTMRGGVVKIDALLEDYAFFAHGLLALHRATKDATYLTTAGDLLAYAAKHFGDERGGYYDTLADQPDLFVRTRSRYDGAVPSANAQMAHNLLALWQRTDDTAHLYTLREALRSLAGPMKQMGAGMAHAQHAAAIALHAAPGSFAFDGEDSPLPGDAPVKPGVAKDQVTVEVSPRQLDLAGGAAEVTVTLTIAEGFHINGPAKGDTKGDQKQPALGLVMTQLRLEAGEGVTLAVDYPDPAMKKLPLGDKPISLYEGKLTIKAKLRRSDGDRKKADSAPRLVLVYQVCTDRECLRAKEVELPVTIR